MVRTFNSVGIYGIIGFRNTTHPKKEPDSKEKNQITSTANLKSPLSSVCKFIVGDSTLRMDK